MTPVGLYVQAALYTLAGINHFVMPQLYLQIMPPYLPRPYALVLLSGAAEIALGLGLLWPTTRPLAAWGIILLLIAVFPANWYMWQARATAFPNVAPWLLLARLPLQGLLIYWAWLYTKA